MPSQAKQSEMTTSKRRLQRQMPMSEAMESESWSRKPRAGGLGPGLAVIEHNYTTHEGQRRDGLDKEALQREEI